MFDDVYIIWDEDIKATEAGDFKHALELMEDENAKYKLEVLKKLKEKYHAST